MVLTWENVLDCSRTQKTENIARNEGGRKGIESVIILIICTHFSACNVEYSCRLVEHYNGLR
jgi:hypothetical protein